MSFRKNLKLGKLAVTGILGHAAKPRGNVIILHGTCDTGSGMKSWLDKISRKEFAFDNYRILYPSAPEQKYTLLNGQEYSVWFDRLAISPQMPEDKVSLDQTAAELSSFLKEEAERSGISLEKTIIGGFSSGGIMALHLGYRFHPEIAGVFTMSSFLQSDSCIYERLYQKRTQVMKPFNTVGKASVTLKLDDDVAALKTSAVRSKLPRLFMTQATDDPLAKYPWGRLTHQKLRNHGVEGYFFTVPNSQHGIVKTELNLLHEWIQRTLQDPVQQPTDERDLEGNTTNDKIL